MVDWFYFVSSWRESSNVPQKMCTHFSATLRQKLSSCFSSNIVSRVFKIHNNPFLAIIEHISYNYHSDVLNKEIVRSQQNCTTNS